MNKNLVNYYIECPEFNDFLELFENEEFKKETCSICNNSITVRNSIEADKYICYTCANKFINMFKEE